LPADEPTANRIGEDSDGGIPLTGEPSLWEQGRSLLVHALSRAGQNQTRGAEVLRISREHLRIRMKRYGLLPDKSRPSRS
jgi:DNA-binding NtrC family response regulator